MAEGAPHDASADGDQRDVTGGSLSSPSEHRRRAIVLFNSLQAALFDRRTGLYWRPGRWPRYESLWPFANAWAATCSVAGLASVVDPAGVTEVVPVLGTRVAAALRYATLKDRGPSVDGPLGLGSTVYRRLFTRLARRWWGVGARYFDDNEWVALALIHQYRLTGERECLELAERISTFMMQGWDHDDWLHPGGIRWMDTRRSFTRNTCSNAPAAEVTAELFLLTGKRQYLEWSRRIYEWLGGALQMENGLFGDLIAPSGKVDRTTWSYNQGAVIGAGVLLFQATSDAAYLEQSHRVARASLAIYGQQGALRTQPPAFVAVYLRNLLLLAQSAPTEDYRRLASAYAEHAWQQRDPASGLIRFDAVADLNTTAPVVAVEAMLAGSEARP